MVGPRDGRGRRADRSPTGRQVLRACVLAIAATIGSACATYRGTAVGSDATEPTRQPGWIWVSGVPTVRQEGNHDCGAASLSAVLAYWGARANSADILAALHHAPEDNVAAKELTAYARAKGFEAYAMHGELSDMMTELGEGRPFIVGVAKPYGEKWVSHYEVVAGFHPPTQSVMTLDPARGWRKNDLAGFLTEWNPTGRVLIAVFPVARE